MASRFSFSFRGDLFFFNLLYLPYLLFALIFKSLHRADFDKFGQPARTQMDRRFRYLCLLQASSANAAEVLQPAKKMGATTMAHLHGLSLCYFY